MAVVLLVGRYEDVARDASRRLDAAGHRCLAALEPGHYAVHVAAGEHDVVVLDPSLSPPERDRAEALAGTARPDTPIVHVRTLAELHDIGSTVQAALDAVVSDRG